MFLPQSLAVGLLSTATLSVMPITHAAEPKPVEVTAMTRNLYLGADVAVALESLPDIESAGDFLWKQVTATDFSARVPELAAEAARAKPDVIGLQEATVWQCRTEFFTDPVVVFDFTSEFLEATREAGVEYRIAAANDSFAIPPLPGMNIDSPETFQALFGQDSASCGFTTGDALLVRSDLETVRSGTTDFDARHPLVKYVWYVDRGYAWADVVIDRTTVRFVTTHLESSWNPGEVTTGSLQAQQLVDDLRATELPLVVMGDFNSDPRDPRPLDEANPGGQPEASAACPAQRGGSPTCNAYWTMINGGFVDAGPDSTDPANYTWGSKADLAGPDPTRVEAGLEMGNTAGWTDRLDYMFTTNGVRTANADVIGAAWPMGPDLWKCDTAAQVANSRAMSEYLFRSGHGRPIAGGRCLPSDHTGLVATLDVQPIADASTTRPTEHTTRKVQWWWLPAAVVGTAVVGITLVIVGLAALLRRRRRRRVPSPVAEGAHSD